MKCLLKIFVYMALVVVLVTGLCGCGGNKSVAFADYVDGIKKEMPFAVDSFKQVGAVVFAFHTKHEQHTMPDYIFKPDGAVYCTRTTLGITSRELLQEGEVWRNLVISKKKGHVLCIDRVIENGRYGGYMYVMQNDNTPFGTYHWDVTDHVNLQMVSGVLDGFLEETKERMSGTDKSLKAPKSQEDYWRLILAADTMKSHVRAEQVLDKAFSVSKYILPCHLSYYAERLASMGNTMAAMRYLKQRIAMEPDFYDIPFGVAEVFADTFNIRKRRYAYNLELKTELEYIFETDQHHRMQWMIASQEVPMDSAKVEKLALRAMETDSMNLQRVKQILQKSGYPSKKDVGSMGSLAVFSVVQHSSLDDQLEMLPALEKAAENDDINAAYMAMLYDRIAVRENRPQKYGTQMDANGKLCPLLDASKVNEWRKEVGMPPIQMPKSR